MREKSSCKSTHPHTAVSLRQVEVPDAEFRLEKALELSLAADGTVSTDEAAPGNSIGRDCISGGGDK